MRPIKFVFSIMLFLVWMPVGGVETYARESFPSGAVAKADGEFLRDGVFRHYLSEKGSGLAGLSKADLEESLKSFIVDWKLAKTAKARGLDRQGDFGKKEEMFDRRTFPNLLFERIKSETTLEEADYIPYFQGLVDTASIRVVVLPTEAQARDTLELARKGESFEELAGKYSIGVSSTLKGVINGITPGDVRFTFEEQDSIFSKPIGEIYGPFENLVGSYSLIQVLKRGSISEQKAEIRKRKQKEILENKAMGAYLKKLGDEMAKSEVEINEEFFGGEGKPVGPQRPYLAWVKGIYIYPEELKVADDGDLHANVKLTREKLNRAIMSIIAVEMAKHEGMRELPAYKSRKESFRIAELARLQTADEVRKAQIKVEEKDIRKYYKEYYKPKSYAIYTVANRDKSKVEAAREKFLAGEDPAELAKRYSTDPSRSRGGTLGYYALPAFDPDIAKRIRSMKAGGVSEMFSIGEIHVFFKLIGEKEAPVPPVDSVRDQIREKLFLQKRARFVLNMRERTLKSTAYAINQEWVGTVE